jgi:two-component system chemotaxis response regulator CheY
MKRPEKEDTMSTASQWPFGLPPAGNTGHGRVLIMDDEPDVRRIIRMTLEKENYDVIEAGDGEEAIALLNKGDNPLLVDAIICDIRMPKLNGVEAIAYFRREYPSVKLIVLTAIPDVELATNFLKGGGCDYLVKPPDKRTLTKAVTAAVEAREMFKGQFVA